jgi:hypothetical protein
MRAIRITSSTLLHLWVFVLLTSCQKDPEFHDVWIEKSRLSEESRWQPVGFAVNGKGFVGLGQGRRDWWSYDPQKNNWLQLGDFPGRSVTRGIALASETKGYVGLGYYTEEVSEGIYDFQASKDIWEYDPLTDQWKVLTQFPGAAHLDAGAFIINNKLYIAAGYKPGQWEQPRDINGCEYLEKEVWEYDLLTGEWAQKESIPLPTFSQDCHRPSNMALGISSQQKGFLLFINNGTTKSELWSFDGATALWNLVPIHLVTWDRQTGLSFVIHNHIYVGDSGDGLFKKHDMASNIDEQDYIPELPGAPKGNGVAFAIRDRGYVFLNDGSLWEYIP